MSMTKKTARLTAVLALAGALVGLGASSAQAYPGWQYAGAYGWPDQCAGNGYVGVQNGSWVRYFCETIIAANPASGPGYYKLWVQ